MDDDRYTRITLRIPKDLHGELQTRADSTSKSLNAEIIDRLQTSFRPSDAEERVMELRNMNLAQATLITLQGGLVHRLLEALPHDAPDGKTLRKFGEIFGDAMEQRSASAASPQAIKKLADWGAEIRKPETRGADFMRSVAAFFDNNSEMLGAIERAEVRKLVAEDTDELARPAKKRAKRTL